MNTIYNDVIWRASESARRLVNTEQQVPGSWQPLVKPAIKMDTSHASARENWRCLLSKAYWTALHISCQENEGKIWHIRWRSGSQIRTKKKKPIPVVMDIQQWQQNHCSKLLFTLISGLNVFQLVSMPDTLN